LNISEIFDQALPEIVAGYVSRTDQLTLAENILSVIESGETGLFEAGTGTGKTLSYLVPALLSDRTVIISTGTKNLQDQIFDKDIPMLRAIFPAKKIALLKGRSNYLCPHRLNLNIKVHQEKRKLHELVEVRTWSSQTRTGDLTEILDPEESGSLISLVTSSRDNCLGAKCPEIRVCPLYQARERASQADIVIVNHHLLFANLAQQEDNLQTLLPDADAVVVDEAHQIPDIARQFFGQRVSSGQLTELIRDGRAELGMLGNDDVVTLDAISQLEKALEALKVRIGDSTEQDFNRWYNPGARKVVLGVDLAMSDLSDHFSRVADRSEGLAQCARRALRFMDQFALLTEETEHESDYVHWIERFERGFVIHLSPMSVEKEMNNITGDTKTAWIFASATLCVDKSFEHFSRELGISSDISARFDSPFDYAAAVRAHIPASLPVPGSDDHTIELVRYVEPIILQNPGRTFFLFTSHRALRKAAEQLQDFERPVLVQGTMSKARLLGLFRSTPACVLLATQSFWEGVDVRGAELKCLIVDKLPFPSPGDPLFSAQSRLLEEKGGNSFREMSLPKTVLSLKQGFGRLIREESDRGLFVVGDNRLRNKAYRKYILNNLPEMQWIAQREDAIAWLRTL
jgi:ATP-dependent DNA helicase DinG